MMQARRNFLRSTVQRCSAIKGPQHVVRGIATRSLLRTARPKQQAGVAATVAAGALIAGVAMYALNGEVKHNTLVVDGALLETDIPGLKKVYRGKVRDVYEVDEHTILHVATDRISSFDVVMTNGIIHKGKILTQLTLWWFKTLEKEEGGCPNHVVTGDINDPRMPAALRNHPMADMYKGRVMLVKKLDMLSVEAIARGYITGSGFNDYKKNGAVCGVELPSGLLDCQQLKEVIFTPSSKAAYGEHDENITLEQAKKIVDPELMDKVVERTLHYYKTGAKIAKAKGIILADTKFEFGMLDGQLVLGDEILTPDCSRFWSKELYAPGRQQDSLDKQFVRNYLLSINFDKTTPIPLPKHVIYATIAKYIEIYTVLTGEEPEL